MQITSILVSCTDLSARRTAGLPPTRDRLMQSATASESRAATHNKTEGASLRRAIHALVSRQLSRGGSSSRRSGYEWRYLVGACWRALATRGLGVADGHLYQFGVFRGTSMLELWDALRPVTRIWGLDSFKGLPLSTQEQVPKWQEGIFRHDPRAAVSAALGTRNVGWISGFYNESLHDDSVASRVRMRPARYIDIDCDLYSSTRDALDFMLRNGLVVPGTLIGYDDIWVLPCANAGVTPLAVGEGRAHAEMASKYDVEFECLAGSCDLKASRYDPGRVSSGWGHRNAADGHFWGAVFLVRSIGRGRASAGFMSASAVLAWREVRACKGLPGLHAYELGAVARNNTRQRQRRRATASTAPKSPTMFKILELVRRDLRAGPMA